MITRLLRKIFGSRNERMLKKLNKVIARINSLEDEMRALPDHEFPLKTAAYRDRLQQGETLDQLMPEAFALIREAGRRTLGMRHFDVQLIGGMVLHHGNIAEMRTGEGKTLVATLSAYLNALTGKGVHVITVNDYLAQRDAAWMGKIYSFVGLATGVIISGLNPEQRRAAYGADITYGTNNEFGFDYLRDNLAFSRNEKVQRPLNYAIVDEVDSILIDEARTPLIISGAVDDRSDLYVSINRLVPKLSRQEVEDGPGDYSVDEKSKQVYLTEAGNERVEQLLHEANIVDAHMNLYDPANLVVLHHLNAALRAHVLFHKDVDYIIKDNQVVIVDEFTGRTMPGRRWSEGLHQAIEAKESVAIQNENQTLATITYQNYFRLYHKLAGMTGTADTEAYEFQQIYALEVIVIPTHMPMVRTDYPDSIYLKSVQKFRAIIADIRDCVQRSQPVLVGTTSIEVSEYLSGLLAKENIRHQVLNAKYHQKEAEIIAQAGQPGAVTIATNMAGRGTDIVLGGNLEAEIESLENKDEANVKNVRARWQERHKQVVDSGGLHIVGTERHESRRIDNQLRGRSGRQGDPGSSRFYLSLEDNLMRIFASDKITAIMQKIGMQEDEAIESPLVSRAIENAQRKVEGHNFDVRKHLLEFDDVANDQRKVIYQQRNDLMEEEDIRDTILSMRHEVVNDVFNQFIPHESVEDLWDVQGLTEALSHDYGITLDIAGWLSRDDTLDENTLREKIMHSFDDAMNLKEQQTSSPIMRRLERQVMLDFLDRHWREHLVAMDHLRHGIHLRSYAAKNPKQEYKREAFAMFVMMLNQFKQDVIRFLARVQIRTEVSPKPDEPTHSPARNLQYSHPAAPSALADSTTTTAAAAPEQAPFVREQRKIGRNEPCPCGSGKKYKNCHGQLN